MTAFDPRTLAATARVKVTGRNPDAITYDAASRRVFTVNGRSANATALDAATGAVAGTIPLGRKPVHAAGAGALNGAPNGATLVAERRPPR